MRLILDDAERLSPWVWSATLPPEDAEVLGSAATRAGVITIVLLPHLAPPSEDIAELSFEPSHAKVLNAGSSARAVFVFGRESDTRDEEEIEPHTYGPRVQHDDGQFLVDLHNLPNELAEVGRQILAGMRSSSGGYFQRTRSGRFVNRPNNFWTVKIQPRNRSLRFTVRGDSKRFSHIRGVTVREDRNGYSSFKLSTADQLDAVLQVLRTASVP